MEHRPENRTTKIPPDVLAQMREDFERQGEYAKLGVLEEIRQEHGVGWAIYCSAFMGTEVIGWRVDICEAMRG